MFVLWPDETHLAREKNKADAEFYRWSREAEANKVGLWGGTVAQHCMLSQFYEYESQYSIGYKHRFLFVNPLDIKSAVYISVLVWSMPEALSGGYFWNTFNWKG